jgi:hypothetical protein
MNSWEWLYCADPDSMLELLGAGASDRKRRLFAVACCRRIWHLIPDGPCRRAVQVSERFADGELLRDELMQAYRLAMSFAADYRHEIRREAAAWTAVFAAEPDTLGVKPARQANRTIGFESRERHDEERAAQAGILREIFGDLPFHRAAVDPSWLAPTVVAMARGIYSENAFDLVPVLGDALEDAGCDDGILAHRRQAEAHVRGCSAVDLLLEKA